MVILFKVVISKPYALELLAFAKEEIKIELAGLLLNNSLYEVTLLRKEPKDFSYSQMKTEIKKQKSIENIYTFSNDFLPKLNISNETVGTYKSHWVMLSKDVLGGDDCINGTRNKKFEIQEKSVKDEGFEIPNLIDVVVNLFMHNLKTGDFIYSDRSNGHKWTYTRVQEENSDGHRIIVGGFSALGLVVSNRDCGYGNDMIGAACARKS